MSAPPSQPVNWTLNDPIHTSLSFNPYDSDTFPDEDIPDAYPDPLIFPPSHQPHESSSNSSDLEVATDSSSIYRSDSIERSRQFIQQVLGNPGPNLHILHTPGLVILPIQDFNLIRNDTRNNRVIRHLIIFPHLDPNFERDHYDFVNSIINLYN